MRQALVLDVVGLTPGLLPHAPRLAALAKRGAVRPLRTITPAVTCSVQSTFLTGLPPTQHGVVANGWYFRDLAQISFWQQSNHLVGGEKVWEAGRRRDPAFTCAKLFWWYNMYSSADFSVTPRPQYPADGRKLPDVYSEPPELGRELQERFGTFPLFQFWGPRSGIVASDWIAKASERVFATRRPTLTLVYLPHLDYDLQRFGPEHPRAIAAAAAVDATCEPLLDAADKARAAIIVLSEYGVTEVTGAIHINRALREAGLLRVRDERMGEQLDPGASEAFAVADHQIAHVYVKRPERTAEVVALLRGLEGIETVWSGPERGAHGLGHPRSGEIVAVSRADRWFSYYYWLRDDRAPDYARTVDIHRKPGYDPAELFVDPTLRMPSLKVAWTLAKRKLGFRSLLDVIGLDASVVRGSHGRPTDDAEAGPLFITSDPRHLPPGPDIAATDVKATILKHVFD